MAKKRKVRVDFRKNRGNRTRQNDLTRQATGDEGSENTARSERVSGKGDLTRRRTVIVNDDESDELRREIDDGCLAGVLLSAVGLNSLVKASDGELYECSVRRVVRTLARDARNAVVTGDRVLIRPSGLCNDSGRPQGVIERVEPRRGVLSRMQDRHEHIIASNVDQAAIIASVFDPPLKTALIDRFLVSCEKGGILPLICLNKADLVPPEELLPVKDRYSRLGYNVVLTSAVTAYGVKELRQRLADRTTVFTGQSGVGKSSLLNAVQPELGLRTGDVSGGSRKGTHTTRRAELLPLDEGGYVVDTPGIRQFSLWEVLPEEVEGYLVEFVRYVPQCRFPDCTHTHEDHCAVKEAVRLGMIEPSRYESYLRMRRNEMD